MIHIFAHLRVIVINAHVPNCKHSGLLSLPASITTLVGLRTDLSDSSLPGQDEIIADWKSD